MTDKKYGRLKAACYSVNVSMAVVANLSPVLFLTFRSLYGISYSLLGLLVLINFLTQLTVDLAFSFFSHKFNITLAVKSTPVLAILGLALYGLSPVIFPRSVYPGLALGTVVFSAASGFAEVLISPVIAAIPSPDPDREMSKLHSVYAWGSVGVILFSTVFILLFGQESWQLLAFALALIPCVSAVLFAKCDIPQMKTPDRVSGIITFLKQPALWLCVAAIFLGGASECTMAQWCSGYLEQAMEIPKIWGDIFGVALFSIMLGLGRTLYARLGKNISRVLFWGAVGAFVCYLTAALCPLPLVGLLAAAMTGFCVSMMWPGSLVAAERKFPLGGVFIFAMMAAGGDLGASVGPQLVGVVTDTVMSYPGSLSLAHNMGITAEQLGMKLGMLSGAVFPLLAILVFWLLGASLKKEKRK